MSARKNRNGLRSDGSVVLPSYQFLKRQPDPPHVARRIALNTVPNEYGTPVTYQVRVARKGKTWWISASYSSTRASNTLRTTKPETGHAWIKAVEEGRVSVAEEGRQ